jgi:glycine/D-amino acid oxidase-like deaminating enzyme
MIRGCSRRRTVNRRSFLETAGLAAIGAGLSRCSSRAVPSTPAGPAARLPPANVSWDRIIRTTVGLRPHRDAGFVVRPERLDHKTLIHNYGHGGAGISLGWGTGQMVAEMALSHLDRKAAVIGCGAVGLTCARELQRRGFDVTIYSMAVPPDTTSNMALAGFTPTAWLVELKQVTPVWEEQFRYAVTIAYRKLQLLVGRGYGVTWVPTFTPTNDAHAASGSIDLLPAEVQTGQVLLGPGEHPFPTTYAVQGLMIRVEPSIYLDALLEDFKTYGGRIVIRKIDTRNDLMWLPESLVVNCTGLGAKEIFGDEELVPLKGQLTVVVPQSDVGYSTNGGISTPSAVPGNGLHMMPRSDGLILGGIAQRGVWSLDVDEGERKRIVEGHIELFHSMHAPVPRGA